MARRCVARAMSFFSTGDHVVDVALPTCRSAAVHGHRRRATRLWAPVWEARAASRAPRPPSRRSRAPPPAASDRRPFLLSQRRPADERPLPIAHEAAEPHLVGRIPLRVDQALAAAVEVHVDEQQTRLRSAPRRARACRWADVERRAAGHERVPDPERPFAARSRSRTRDRPCNPCARSATGTPSIVPRVIRKYFSPSMSASATARSSAPDVGPWSASAATCLADVLDRRPAGPPRSGAATAGSDRPPSTATSSRRAW